ncbi:amino acid ABC transporter ATP-binding protein [Diaphorobacter aerolatus]|uniref:Amino acid ABC transporter ATP-binding protein n=1 Tax=Diaphorobacter aerolatus TaxID=1288495 RepID=A0A7H0GJ90_9BURK|nr:amino acid ABC transporter ATP-binding protein [Diaphorobacter aerolatus]
MIKLENVSKKFGKNNVLTSINLTFCKEEVVVICGPSGSGKSTLIKTINGLEPINGGAISYNGRNIDQIPATTLSKHVGMVFQDFGLFANKTVLDNLVVPQVVVHQVNRATAVEKAIEQLSALGMAAHKDKYPDQLSGGQKQRVAIARALVTKPEYVLFDEPTSALDPEMVGDVLSAIEKIVESGIGAVIVTHEMAFAKRISDRVIFMDAGRVVESSKSEDFFNEPKSQEQVCSCPR